MRRTILPILALAAGLSLAGAGSGRAATSAHPDLAAVSAFVASPAPAVVEHVQYYRDRRAEWRRREEERRRREWRRRHHYYRR